MSALRRLFRRNRGINDATTYVYYNELKAFPVRVTFVDAPTFRAYPNIG